MTRYTWSRVAPNVIEHVAIPDLFGQPICGTELSVRTQTFGDEPSGYAPLCPRCTASQKRIGRFAGRFLAEADGQPVEPTDDNLAAAFANTVKPIPAYLYPAVRERITEIRAERAGQEN